MKKIFSVLMLAVMALPLMAKDNDTTYVPNKFKDNWEFSLGVGASWEGRGMLTKSAAADFGFGGDLTATKWFNPYWGGRFGLQAEYGHNQFNGSTRTDKRLFDYYVHGDVMWNWSNQFGGYKANRVYNAVPYVHVGIFGTPEYKCMVAGGLGLLNRFRVSDHVTLNLDLRGTVTSGRKIGCNDKLAYMAGVFFGFSYRFNEANWKPVSRNTIANSEKIAKENELLVAQAAAEAEKAAKAQKEAADAKAALAKAQREAAANAAITAKERANKMLSDLKSMTVHYELGKTSLTDVEKGHLRTYLQVIELSGEKDAVNFEVIGRADTSTGYEAKNREIATKRAENIKKELMKQGIAENKITTKIELVNTGNAKLDRAAVVNFSK